MSTDTGTMLADYVDRVAETVREFAASIMANDTDEPMLADGSSIYEWPLEIVDERGREFAVVITTGGPHIELVANGCDAPRLVGYWGGETVTRYDTAASEFATVMDYLIER